MLTCKLFSLKCKAGANEMAQWVVYVLCKHEDLSLALEHPCIKQDIDVHL